VTYLKSCIFRTLLFWVSKWQVVEIFYHVITQKCEVLSYFVAEA